MGKNDGFLRFIYAKWTKLYTYFCNRPVRSPKNNKKNGSSSILLKCGKLTKTEKTLLLRLRLRL